MTAIALNATTPTETHPLDHVSPAVLRPGRALHILDLENLNKGPADDYRHVVATWRRTIGLAPSDLAVVGVDVTGAFPARDAFPEAGLVVGKGENGADRALTRRADANLSTHRYDTLIVGSGDGHFTHLALNARNQGLHVLVASHKGNLSAKLHNAASRIIWL